MGLGICLPTVKFFLPIVNQIYEVGECRDEYVKPFSTRCYSAFPLNSISAPNQKNIIQYQKTYDDHGTVYRMISSGGSGGPGHDYMRVDGLNSPPQIASYVRGYTRRYEGVYERFVNSLAPGRCGSNIRCTFFHLNIITVACPLVVKLQVNATESQYSGNGLVLSGNKSSMRFCIDVP